MRLIGAGIYNLSGEEGRQLSLEGFFEGSEEELEGERKELFDALQERYQLDFAGHLDQIFQMDTMHRTIEYMRRRRRA